ncbi:MAG TPA: flagellar biosynthesis anti-sigma factor FlgM [Phycisphaerales bacterium]|nr:flagellar biosynthesis anti-sigma factor FlgM [Phycisphaerales bacterium]
MSSVPNITPGYPSNRPQVVGRIGQHKGTVSTPADIAAAILANKSDTVEFSSEAIAAASTPADTAETSRAQRLAQIKARIQAGTYDEDAKLTIVADRLSRLFGNA